MRLHSGMIALATTLLVAGGAPSNGAALSTYYGNSASSAASSLGCKKFSGNGGGEFNRDSGVCWLRGKRVNVITFDGPRQQSEWNGAAKISFGPGFFWANGRGALIVAKNGNRSAAALGADLLPGKVSHG